MTADERFARCLALVLVYEGGFVDDPRDPGGATNKGVTLQTLSSHLGRSATIAELKLIDAATLSAIYRVGFWDKLQGDQLPAGVDLACFDAAVNCGPERAAQWLQHAAGVVEDGAIGSHTLQAVDDANDSFLVEDIRQQRASHYRSLSTFPAFGRGWMTRLESVSQTAQAWATPRRT